MQALSRTFSAVSARRPWPQRIEQLVEGSKSASPRDSTFAARVVGVAWLIVGLRGDELGSCLHSILVPHGADFCLSPPASSVTRNPSAIRARILVAEDDVLARAAAPQAHRGDQPEETEDGIRRFTAETAETKTTSREEGNGEFDPGRGDCRNLRNNDRRRTDSRDERPPESAKRTHDPAGCGDLSSRVAASSRRGPCDDSRRSLRRVAGVDADFIGEPSEVPSHRTWGRRRPSRLDPSHPGLRAEYYPGKEDSHAGSY